VSSLAWPARIWRTWEADLVERARQGPPFGAAEAGQEEVTSQQTFVVAGGLCEECPLLPLQVHEVLRQPHRPLCLLAGDVLVRVLGSLQMVCPEFGKDEFQGAQALQRALYRNSHNPVEGGFKGITSHSLCRRATERK
jgi:hypothetical protein